MKRGNALPTTLRGVIRNSHVESLTAIFSGQITLILAELASDTYLRRTVFARGGDRPDEIFKSVKWNRVSGGGSRMECTHSISSPESLRFLLRRTHRPSRSRTCGPGSRPLSHSSNDGQTLYVNVGIEKALSGGGVVHWGQNIGTSSRTWK